MHPPARRQRVRGTDPLRGHCKLAPDMVQRIAVYIPNHDDFFRYLEAFTGTSNLGSLEHLWHLSTAHRAPWNLWPVLHVHSEDYTLMSGIEDVCMYFDVIHLHDVYNLELLKGWCTHGATLECHRCPQSDKDVLSVPLAEWYAQLAMLPVTHLAWSPCNDSTSPHHLVETLPRLANLRTLNLDFASISPLSAVMSFVATSKLTSLSLCDILVHDDADYPDQPSDPTLSSAFAQNFIDWLTHQPVQSLCLANWDLSSNIAASERLNRDLWNCATLRHLSLRHMHMHNFSLEQPDTPMELVELTLFDCSLGTHDFVELAVGLCHSNVEVLNLGCNTVDSSGIVAIAESLPLTPIRVLELMSTNMDEVGCKALALALPRCANLKQVDFSMNDLTTAAIMPVVDVVRSIPLLKELRLQGNRMAGLVALVQLTGMRSQPGPITLDLRWNSLDKEDKAILTDMASILAVGRRPVILHRNLR